MAVRGGKGQRGMRGEVCCDQHKWVVDTEHDDQVIRLPMMQGEMYCGGGITHLPGCSDRS